MAGDVTDNVTPDQQYDRSPQRQQPASDDSLFVNALLESNNATEARRRRHQIEAEEESAASKGASMGQSGPAPFFDNETGDIETGSSPASKSEDGSRNRSRFSALRQKVAHFFHGGSDEGQASAATSREVSREAPLPGGPSQASAPNRRALNLGSSGLTPGPDNWQEILHAHADCNAKGNPIDDAGKEINLRDMHAEFGRRLAQTCNDLDAAGFQGQYSILSGVRTHAEQLGLYNYYKGIGSSHPVAVPGTSPHEWGLATDLQYKGRGSAAAFYKVLHEKGRNNGMEFVSGDENHVQLAKVHDVIASLREDNQRNKNFTLTASSATPASATPKASVARNLSAPG